jgi:hypothetical protein
MVRGGLLVVAAGLHALGWMKTPTYDRLRTRLTKA